MSHSFQATVVAVTISGSILLGILWDQCAIGCVAQIWSTLSVNATFAAGDFQLRSVVALLWRLPVLGVVRQLLLVSLWVFPVELCCPAWTFRLSRCH